MVVIPCIYSKLRSFSEGLAEFQISYGENWGFISKLGTALISCQYAETSNFNCGLAMVGKGKMKNIFGKVRKYGYIDKTGKEVVPLEYDHATDFNDDIAIVYRGGIDWKNGQKNIYNEAYAYFIKSDGSYLDIDHKWFNNKYNGRSSNGFYDGLCCVENKNYKYGFINKMGKEIISCKYDFACHFIKGLAAIKIDDKWGYINTSGNLITPILYDKVDENPYDQYIRVKKNNKWGLLNRDGKELIHPFYDNIFVGSNSIGVLLNGKWGFLNTEGKQLIPFSYDEIGRFSEGLAPVKFNNEWFYINQIGERVSFYK